MNAERGFTLIELVVTLVVAGILIGIAIPSFRSLTISNRLSALANDYVSSLQEARMDAIRRNSPTQFCGATGNGTDTLGASCGVSPGQIAALDSDGAATITRSSPDVRPDLIVKTARGMRFSGQGLARAASAGGAPYNGLVLDLASSQISSRNRRCIYLSTGSSIATCAITNATTCPENEPTPCQ